MTRVGPFDSLLLIVFWVSDEKPLDGLPVTNMRVEDLEHIFRLDAAIPDLFGVDHYGRPNLTCVKTSCLICAYNPFETSLLDLSFHGLADLCRALRRAASSLVIA